VLKIRTLSVWRLVCHFCKFLFFSLILCFVFCFLVSYTQTGYPSVFVRASYVFINMLECRVHPCMHRRLLYNFLWLLMTLLTRITVGWTVEDPTPVPVHWLAGTRSPQVRRRIHRLRRSGAQDEGAVRSGRTNHRSLQVKYLTSLIDLLTSFRQIHLWNWSIDCLTCCFPTYFPYTAYNCWQLFYFALY